MFLFISAFLLYGGYMFDYSICMHRGCPLRKWPLLRAVQLGQREGPIGLVGPISQPRGTIDTTLGHTKACYALSEPTLL